ncbi:putative deleted in lung and esophageal cancer protein 1 [Apostichopus japonicus]|uniref:Putative deleted in lung and esophageal cancer protein 1 n=1 Tax=Stichopus japonicus TaxID=307972 RepID=A0A2G8JDL9_STIJA|nr:putative deleted in lung and esophageal cancer protein 1 [Apostichopus japonicus]
MAILSALLLYRLRVLSDRWRCHQRICGQERRRQRQILLMPRDCWPATSFKSVSAGDKTELPPFLIQPAMFELQAGHAISLYITFSPRSASVFEKMVTIVCDNCNVKHFTIKAQHHIKFKPVNPLTMETKHIVIQNTTNVELPYFWQCYRPIPVNPRPEVDDQSEDTTNQLNIADRQLDGSMVFHINPDRGTLAPGGKTKATVCFAPPGTYFMCYSWAQTIRNLSSKTENTS